MSRVPAYSANLLLCTLASDDRTLLEPGLTRAASEDRQVLVPRSGHVAIQDRDELKDIAGDAYGLSEVEYRRLIGPLN
jgi:hypothetical protein